MLNLSTCEERLGGPRCSRSRISSRFEAYPRFSTECISKVSLKPSFGSVGIQKLCSMREDAGQTIKSSISHSWTKDTRDDKITASRGYYAKLFQELAGLSGDVSFYKAEVESQISRCLVPGLVRFVLATT